jgi:hypothetical protein
VYLLTSLFIRENPIDINRELGKAMAIIGDYIDIYEDNLSLSQAQYHSSAVLRLQGFSVYAPAIRPRFTLDKWTDEMSEAVANMAAGFNRRGMPVWLRFAWEMNGGWYEYGNDPTNFKNAWMNLTNKVRATTNETYMLWSPNVRYGETESQAGYQPYYPGEQCECSSPGHARIVRLIDADQYTCRRRYRWLVLLLTRPRRKSSIIRSFFSRSILLLSVVWTAASYHSI